MRFDTRPADTFLLVGVARDLVLSPRSHLGGMVYCFLVLENGERLHFILYTIYYLTFLHEKGLSLEKSFYQ
jgi:hypothetical protein